MALCGLDKQKWNNHVCFDESMDAFQDLSVSFVYSLVTLFYLTARTDTKGVEMKGRDTTDQYTNQRCAEVKFRLFKY